MSEIVLMFINAIGFQYGPLNVDTEPSSLPMCLATLLASLLSM